jgi:hypothetical protein
MCPFLHCCVYSLVAEIFEFPVESGILGPYQMSSRQRFFSHSVDCLLRLVTVSFAVQKLFSLMHSHLFVVALRWWAFCVLYRKSFPIPICSSVFSTASWNCFKTSGLTLRSLIHFELILVWVKDKDLVSVFYMRVSTFPSSNCWRGYLFSIVFLGFFVENQLAINV